MNSSPVVFLDSGIGGIPYCEYFHARNPGEPLVYVADRRHFPYGGRDRGELASILAALTGELVSLCNPKLLVLACNTATVSALAGLREAFPSLPLVGTVPAVKPAVSESQRGRVGVLGTARTIEDPYITELAARLGKGCEIIKKAAPGLVEFVERRYAQSTPEERARAAGEYIDFFRAAGADALVLGCTHFLFLLDEFRHEAAPDIRVYDSIEGISRRAESLLDEGGLRIAPGEMSSAQFVITGSEAPEASWQYWAERLGFRLSLLQDLGTGAR